MNKGSIKVIDRAKNLSDRLMHTGVRIKDEVYQIGSREERNETSYATDSSMDIGRKTVRAGGRSISEAPRQIRRGIVYNDYAYTLFLYTDKELVSDV